MSKRLSEHDVDPDLLLGRLDRLDGVGTRTIDVTTEADPGTAAYLAFMGTPDAVHEAQVAQDAHDLRTEPSGLTVGQIQDHLRSMVTLATSVERYDFETPGQIAEAILMLQADLGDLLDEAVS